MYFVFVLIPDTELLKPGNFLIGKSDKSILRFMTRPCQPKPKVVYENEVTLGKHPRMGLVARGTKHVIRGLVLSVPSPDIQEGESG